MRVTAASGGGYCKSVQGWFIVSAVADVMNSACFLLALLSWNDTVSFGCIVQLLQCVGHLLSLLKDSSKG